MILDLPSKYTRIPTLCLKRIVVDLRLTGYVENLDNGTVEILAQGPNDILQEFESRVHSAPRPIVVREMLQSIVKNGTTLTDFEVR